MSSNKHVVCIFSHDASLNGVFKQIKWFKDEGNIPDGSEITELGFLKIYRVLEEDEGNYYCTATNSEGHITSKTGQLVISGELSDNSRVSEITEQK